MKFVSKPLFLNKLKSVLMPSLLCSLFFLLSACGDGSTSTPQQIDKSPTRVAVPTVDFSKLVAITSANIDSAQLVTIHFQVVDDEGIAITDVMADDLRFTVAKLQISAETNLSGNWQSYLNKIEQPGVGEGTLPKLQATQENGKDGEFINNQNGTYAYTFKRSLNESQSDILAQAKTENLNLTFNDALTHRVALEIRNQSKALNTTFDWIPATGKSQFDGIFSHNIVANENCATCHGQLSAHGGSRVDVKYCVTCHNPGSTDANSTNTVNFKNMIHKIHRGKNLPSVLEGGKYSIYGFNDTEHDFSQLSYPADITTCNQCHAGTATADEEQTITKSGDNWQEIVTMQACGSCHDDLNFSNHLGGQVDNTNCRSCHQNSAVAGSVADRHKNLVTQAQAQFLAKIISVTQTAIGEFPQIQFSIVNPLNNNQAYDILSDPEFTQSNGLSRLAATISWSTLDYTNTANQGDNASSVQIDALETATAVGDGSFVVTSPIAIPDGNQLPTFTATGSGSVTIEGHPAAQIIKGSSIAYQAVPLINVVSYFSIDEATGSATTRREVVKLSSCLSCHGQLSLHGGNRTDNIESCVTCHNPRNTDKRVRNIAQTPPTDGKDEESLDFKTMIHGIHAVTKREHPLQIVGFKGFSTHTFERPFPQNIGNCSVCHAGDSFTLPISENVLATTVDTGADRNDPTDDVVISPNAAICSSCHDDNSAKSHMESNGANFTTSQQNIDNGVVIEQCSICHGIDREYDVKKMHPID